MLRGAHSLTAVVAMLQGSPSDYLPQGWRGWPAHGPSPAHGRKEEVQQRRQGTQYGSGNRGTPGLCHRPING